MMNMRTFRRCSPRVQSGAAMVEFAFVFPLLFFLLYGTIVYSYIFVVQSSLNFAAEQAAQSAVAVSPDAPRSLVTDRAIATATNLLIWLPTALRPAGFVSVSLPGVTPTACPGSTALSPGPSDVVVTICVSNINSVFPQISIPGIGAAPPFPSRLGAQAAVQIQ
jgi:hypothetical protein